MENKNNIFTKLENLANLISRLTMYVVTFLTGLMVLTVFLGVIFRYIIRNPLGWSEEFARYLMIWAALLTVSVGIKKKEHVGILLFVKMLPLTLARILTFGVNIIILFFLGVLTYKGYFMAVGGLRQISQGLGITMFWPLMSVPVSGALAIIQQILQIILTFDPERGFKDVVGETEIEEALEETEQYQNN